jgi:hypothetical protein
VAGVRSHDGPRYSSAQGASVHCSALEDLPRWWSHRRRPRPAASDTPGIIVVKRTRSSAALWAGRALSVAGVAGSECRVPLAKVIGGVQTSSASGGVVSSWWQIVLIENTFARHRLPPSFRVSRSAETTGLAGIVALSPRAPCARGRSWRAEAPGLAALSSARCAAVRAVSAWRGGRRRHDARNSFRGGWLPAAKHRTAAPRVKARGAGGGRCDGIGRERAGGASWSAAAASAAAVQTSRELRRMPAPVMRGRCPAGAPGRAATIERGPPGQHCCGVRRAHARLLQRALRRMRSSEVTAGNRGAIGAGAGRSGRPFAGAAGAGDEIDLTILSDSSRQPRIAIGEKAPLSIELVSWPRQPGSGRSVR